MLYKLKQVRLKKIALFFLARILFRFTAMSQNQVIAAANGEPALSVEMVNQYIYIYEYLLGIKLTAQQKHTLQEELIHYWKSNK